MTKALHIASRKNRAKESQNDEKPSQEPQSTNVEEEEASCRPENCGMQFSGRHCWTSYMFIASLALVLPGIALTLAGQKSTHLPVSPLLIIGAFILVASLLGAIISCVLIRIRVSDEQDKKDAEKQAQEKEALRQEMEEEKRRIKLRRHRSASLPNTSKTFAFDKMQPCNTISGVMIADADCSTSFFSNNYGASSKTVMSIAVLPKSKRNSVIHVCPTTQPIDSILYQNNTPDSDIPNTVKVLHRPHTSIGLPDNIQ